MMCAIGPAMRRLLEAAEKAPIQGVAQGPRPARTWAGGGEWGDGSLERLVQRGYLQEHRGPHGRRDFTITTAGRAALRGVE